MRSFLVHWALSSLALALTAWILPGVTVSSPAALVAGALVLGFLNAVVRPVLLILTLPLTILTLGLFYLVLNGLLFALAATVVPGFAVAGFGSAMLGAILTGVASTLFASVTRRAEADQKGPR